MQQEKGDRNCIARLDFVHNISLPDGVKKAEVPANI